MPRGRLRLIVPDGGLYIKLYMDGLNGKPDVKFPRPNDAFVTPMMYVNECFRDWGHLYAYDFVTFQFFIKAAGFSDVVQRKYMEGDDPALLLDSPERAEESLFIEAVNF